MEKVYALIFLLLTGWGAVQAQVVWTETFESLSNGTENDPAPDVRWTTTQPSGGTFSKQNSLIYGGIFRIENTVNEGEWRSQVIDISAYGLAVIDMDVYSFIAGSTDYLRAYYKVDGGPEVPFFEFVGAGIDDAAAASAFVTGNSIQVIIRAKEVSPTIIFIPSYLAFDNLTITGIKTLYSRKNGNWNDVTTGNASWSENRTGTPSCNCMPNSNTRAVIQNSHTISLSAAGDATIVEVESGGKFQWTSNTNMRLFRGGYFNNSGTVDQNGRTAARITFGQAFEYDINNYGTFTTEGIEFSLAATLNVNGTQPVDADNLVFSTDNATLNNNGQLTVGSLLATNGMDNNAVNNATAGTFNVGAINPGNGNLIINNAGTINLSGNITNVDGGSAFTNRSSGIWRWSLTPLTSFDGELDDILDLTDADNTFEYNAAGPQNILAESYQNLIASNSGTKTYSAALDVNRDLTLRNTAIISSGGNVADVDGNITIENDAILAGNGNVQIGGNWSATNASSFTEGSRTVTFDGTGNQSITNAAGLEDFYNLTINKSGGLAVLGSGSDVTVGNTLALTQRGVDLNGQTLLVANSATNAITGSGYVLSEKVLPPYGSLARRAEFTGSRNFSFPFATSSGTAIPVSFNVSNPGSGTDRTVSISTYPTAADNAPFPSGVTSMINYLGVDASSAVVDRFWVVRTSGYTTQPTAAHFLSFLGTEATGATGTRSAYKWTPLTGGNGWGGAIGASTANPFPITGSSVDNFAVWAIGSNTTPLPVSLIDFDATVATDHVLLTWATATEQNNDYFTVERSTDAVSFKEVVKVPGNGTTYAMSHYTAIDPAPAYGRNYYRLKQTDHDKQVSYSALRMIDYKGPSSASLSVYPNPSGGNHITVEITGLEEEQQVPVEILTVQGQAVYSRMHDVSTAGFLKLEIAFDNPLNPGIYIVKSGKSSRMMQKLVIRQ